MFRGSGSEPLETVEHLDPALQNQNLQNQNLQNQNLQNQNLQNQNLRNSWNSSGTPGTLSLMLLT
jgi:uncharacterized protein YjbI with pentapeptide repeats